VNAVNPPDCSKDDAQESIPMYPLNDTAEREYEIATGTGVMAALKALTGVPHIARNFTYVHRVAERPAQYAAFPAELDPRLANALRMRGIEQLYTHQASAVQAALSGQDTVIVTPTASGKTLCFNLPVLQTLLNEPQARALYLFPTKALAQDQYNELYELAGATGEKLKVYTFDGDTPANARRAIRVAGSIVLTNPDMLHSGILPHHTTWIKLFENLRYVVIDELHHYRGVFGSHVANVLRRLARICSFYGTQPQFICCSATIANPKEHAERLTGREFKLINENGAPAGEKYFLFYNPPVVNEELGIRRGVVNEARRLATRFLAADTQTIIFARSRMRVELLMNYLRKSMRKLHKDPMRIAGYRGGYLPNERRAIEQGVKSGAILGVVSTNALELGIDIGQLKAAIIAGYPGSVASTWQQAGRAGRKAEAAVIVLIANSSPLDQFLAGHAEYFFGKPPEAAIVNADNVAILANHIKCAAFELPFVESELFGDVSPEPVLSYLADQRVLRKTGDKWYWSSDIYPSEGISLRSASAQNFVVVNVADKNLIMAEIDYDSAPFLIHTEAIYMHMSNVYYIENLDWDRRTAYARPQASDYYTDALAKSDIRVIQVDMTESVLGSAEIEQASETPRETVEERLSRKEEFPLLKNGDSPAAAHDLPASGSEIVALRIEHSKATQLPPETPDATPPLNLRIQINPVLSRNFGEVVVSTIIAKYKKIRFETHENVGYGEIHVPPLEMQTEAYWITLTQETGEEMQRAGLDLGAGLSGIASLLSHIVPLFVICDPSDVVSVPMVRAPHDECPTIYLYDRYPGGIGLARKVYDLDRRIFIAAREILNGCGCTSGCPSCVGPETGMNSNAKLSARILLDAMLRSENGTREDSATQLTPRETK
jgi:DEAD/DEAH box helicase domain-containing protein